MEIHNKQRLKYAGFLVCSMLLLAPPTIARADEPQNPYEMSAEKASIPQRGVNSIKTTIKAQLDAISSRDATLAYSFMTEHSHSDYDDARDFLSDMRFKFGAIYNHVDIEFLHSYGNGQTSVQKVQLKDRYTGEQATVVYKLIMQSSGDWLIDSFAVIETDEAQPI